MQYIEYIQNGNSGRGGGWSLPLNYHPSITTNVKMVVKAETGEDGSLFVGSTNSSGDFFRFFSYEEGMMYFDCPSDSDARLGVPVGSTVPTEWEMGVDSNGNYYLTNLTTQVSSTGSSFYERVFSSDFYVWDETGVSTNVAQGQKLYYIEIYENGVKVKDYRPVIDNNSVVCLYETIGGTYHYCSSTLTAGPTLSSISATPSKASLAATGETINIVVDCDNAWTVSGNTWLTLSSTGDTGSTTITATAPDYSGSTNRTDTLVFTDTDTGDEVTLTIKQKKFSNGQPVYLGDFEISEMYLGETAITEAYLGDVLVFSTGPFNGMKVTPTELTFNTSRTSGSTKVKCSEYWEITSLPSWLSASTTSGDSGETIVTFENISQSADTADTITFESANYSEDVDVSYSEVAYNYIEGVRSSSAPFWDLDNYLDTGIYVTGDEDTRVRIKYYGGGEFSDRIVGFDANETGGDDNADFRYFPTMADAGEGRIDGLYGLYNDGQYYDITFGNLFVYDNLNSTMVSDIGSFTGISTNVSIRIDMSVNWIKEVIIMREINGTWTDIADFIAAEDNGTYGMYDEIGDTFLTKNDLVGLLTPPSQS